MKIILTLGLVIGMISTLFGQTEDDLKNLGKSLKDSSFTSILYDGASLKETPNYSSKVLFVFTEDKRVTVLPQGKRVTVLDYNNLHFKVCIDSICGYVDESWIFKSTELNSFIKDYNKVKDKVDNINFEKKRISINSVDILGINSANGVKFSIRWGYFDKSKIIKYIYFTVVPYNEVGDYQTCEIRKNSTFIGQVTGPIKSSFDFRNPTWENAWYNNTIRCIKLTKVKVEYTDGTTYTYVKELPKILDSNFSNNCDYKE